MKNVILFALSLINQFSVSSNFGSFYCWTSSHFFIFKNLCSLFSFIKIAEKHSLLKMEFPAFLAMIFSMNSAPMLGALPDRIVTLRVFHFYYSMGEMYCNWFMCQPESVFLLDTLKAMHLLRSFIAYCIARQYHSSILF